MPPPVAADEALEKGGPGALVGFIPRGGVASALSAAYKGVASECSAARLAHLSGGQGVVGSNPATPTILLISICFCSQ